MTKTTLNFVHANGFPAGSYQALFDSFPDNINVIALDKYGHDPDYPIKNNWQPLVEQLIHFVEQKHNFAEPVVAVGHSFGGVLSFIAACQRPDLFKGLIMIDPPVFTGSVAMIARLIKKTPLIDKFSPAGRAKKRRSHWPIGSNVAELFSRRTLFKNFDPRCLNDYVKHGIVKRNDQLELAFSAKVEANIFRDLPTNLTSYKNKLTIPAKLIYAEQTDVCPIHYFKKFAKLNKNMHLSSVPGGHMFPLERPEETAQLIMDTIKEFS